VSQSDDLDVWCGLTFTTFTPIDFEKWLFCLNFERYLQAPATEAVLKAQVLLVLLSIDSIWKVKYL
jgi:hypothetical protein